MDADSPAVAACVGGIDCDVHPATPRRQDLLPFLDEYWYEAILTRDIDLLELSSYPSQTRPSRRPDWMEGTDSLERIRHHLLEPFGLRHAILNCVCGIQAIDPAVPCAMKTGPLH